MTGSCRDEFKELYVILHCRLLSVHGDEGDDEGDGDGGDDDDDKDDDDGGGGGGSHFGSRFPFKRRQEIYLGLESVEVETEPQRAA